MEKRQLKLLFVMLVLLLATACGGASQDVVETTIGAVEESESLESVPTLQVTRLVTVIVELEAESGEEIAAEEAEREDPLRSTTIAGGQEYSSGQEFTSQATPRPPREKVATSEPLTVVASAEPTNSAEVRVESVATEVPLAAVASPIVVDSIVPTINPIPTTTPIPSPTPFATIPVVTPVSPRPEATPTPDIPQEDELAAGVIDDNVSFDAYLDYLKGWDDGEVIPVDVSIRKRFKVIDSAENPIHAAKIEIHRSREGGTPIATLRTHADGSALFFPAAFNLDLTQTHFAIYDDGVDLWIQEFQPLGNETTQIIQRETAQQAAHEAALKLDILLLLDATGSMGDEIQQLKDNIRRIAQHTIDSPANPFLRFGLVSYRDIEDEYVTRLEDFSADYPLFEERLRAVKALGGGDYPEDLNQGLHDAVHRLNWDSEAIQLIFLVADAPPHLNYSDDNLYVASAFTANERGIKIYPIASSGLDQQGEYIFRQLAQLTDSKFIFLVDDAEGNAQSGGEAETGFAVSDFTVGALDDIVIEIIESELSHQAP